LLQSARVEQFLSTCVKSIGIDSAYVQPSCVAETSIFPLKYAHVS